MSALVLGYGNTLRRDDGVAERTLALLGSAPGVERRLVQQLTPEIASEIAHADITVFVDADVDARTVRITPVRRDDTSGAIADALPQPHGHSGLSHSATPAHIVQIARALFGAHGSAFVCSVPVTDLSPGEGLSARAAISARIAARAIRRFLQECGPGVKFQDTEERW